MTLTSEAKFEEKLILASKNDGKSESFNFDLLLLSIAYKVLAKKVQKNDLSQH